MDGATFINMAFQFAALNNFALHVDKTGTEVLGGTWEAEARVAYDNALDAGENPRCVDHAEHGKLVTHDFGDEDEDEELMRMVCWAEMGPEKTNKTACDWWKAQGNDPDKYVPGVTDLHRGSDD